MFKDRGFESRYRILNGRFLQRFDVKSIRCLFGKTENNR